MSLNKNDSINLLKMFLYLILGLVLVFVVLPLIRSWQVNNSAQNKVFLGGKVPASLPEGFYRGAQDNPSGGGWIGKRFDSKNSSGINIILNKGEKKERFRFKTYVGKGVVDKNLDVLKIDYNLEGNQFFIKRILDEIVEIEPNHYLGKAHVQIIPGLPFTVTFFELKKE